MSDAEKLLKNWLQKPPNGIKWGDARKVLESLGMEVEINNNGHPEAFHKALVDSPQFPFGSFAINCHAHGEQGEVHFKAIRDIIKAAKIIRAAQREQQNDEDK